MRRIPDGREPQELKDFREIRPDATWEDFKNEAQEGYKRLVEQIVSHQNGQCAYCEINLTEYDRMIEHFHPKSDTSSGHNWALDFHNMLATCKGGTNPHSKDEMRFVDPLPENLSCDQRKGDKILDGVILHPRDIPASPPVFQVGMTGELRPHEKHCKQTGVAVEKIQAAIDTENLNLNCNRLKDARRTVWDQLLLREYNGEPADKLMNEYLLPENDGRLFRFFTTIRSYFSPDAEQIIRLIPSD